MDRVRIKTAGYEFIARFEPEKSPKTCAKFRAMLPYKERIIHVRWSGEGCWIPLGDLNLGLPYEDPTSYPAPGEIILYPGGVSETEILLSYGNVCFASKAGQLASSRPRRPNPFLTDRGTENAQTRQKGRGGPHEHAGLPAPPAPARSVRARRLPRRDAFPEPLCAPPANLPRPASP